MRLNFRKLGKAEKLLVEAVDLFVLDYSGTIQGDMAADDLALSLELAEEELQQKWPIHYKMYMNITVNYVFRRSQEKKNG
jgi:hypothetical protein